MENPASQSEDSNFRPILDNIPGTSSISNLRNTCYVSASLQALSHCRPLLAFPYGFYSNFHATATKYPKLQSSSCGIDSSALTLQEKEARARLAFCFIQSMISLSSTSSLLDPNALISAFYLVDGNKTFEFKQQHDAQEFIATLLDYIEPVFNPLVSISSFFRWKVLRVCGDQNIIDQPLDLILYPRDSSEDLINFLPADTKINFIPDVARFLICRWNSSNFQKNTFFVNYPQDGLDLSSLYTFANDKLFQQLSAIHSIEELLDAFNNPEAKEALKRQSALLDLTSVVVQKGDLSTHGHYTAFSRIISDHPVSSDGYSGRSTLWIEHDDENCDYISNDSVASRDAYLLFYSLRPTKLQEKLRTYFLRRIIEDNNNDKIPSKVILPGIWLIKLKELTHPGPVSYSSLFCLKHGNQLGLDHHYPIGKPLSSEIPLMLSISVELFSLIDKVYGCDGPVLKELPRCKKCLIEVQKRDEKLKLRIAMTSPGDQKRYLSKKWVSEYKSYLSNDDETVSMPKFYSKSDQIPSQTQDFITVSYDFLIYISTKYGATYLD